MKGRKKIRRSKFAVPALLCAAMALSLSVSACAASGDFSDVPPSSWYYEAVQFVSGEGLMVGIGGNKFLPEGTFTRAQFATVLYRIAKEPSVSGTDSFSDTKPGAWYSDAVLWASSEGLIKGYGKGLFGTDDPVTQEQLVTLLWRYDGEPEAKSAVYESAASDYAKEAAQWARETGVISDSSDYTFAPQSAASRAQVAALLYNYLNREKTEMEISLKIDGTRISVDWLDNETVTALREKLADGDVTVQMNKYGGFEQVGALGFSLPRNDVQTTTDAGDIVLYSGNQIVMFYGSNSWAYTRLGKITGLSNAELKALLGNENVTVALSLE